MHKWDKQYHIAFGIMLVTGVALCIGGIWLPPLLIPGGVFLTGALAMYASAWTRMYPWKQDDIPIPVPSNEPAREIHPVNQNTYIQNNMLFMYIRKFSGRLKLTDSESPSNSELQNQEPENRLTLV